MKALKIETVCSFQTLISSYRSTRRYIEDQHDILTAVRISYISVTLHCGRRSYYHSRCTISSIRAWSLNEVKEEMLDEPTNGRTVELFIFCLFIHACTLYPGSRQLPLERVFTRRSSIMAVLYLDRFLLAFMD
jgi:hypothetical protein